MPRMIFPDGFDWHVKPSVTIYHKPGIEYLVTQACADEAVAAGKGKLLPTPARSKSKAATPDASQ